MLIAERALRDRRRSLVWWASGIAAYMVMIVAIWPSIRDSDELLAAIEDYPEALKAFFGGAETFDYATAAGFLHTQLYSLMLPLLLTILAIGMAGATLAGEEERGLLDLLLSHPVSRTRAVLEKAAAIGAATAAVGVVAWLAVWLMGLAVDLGVGPGRLFAATTGSVLLALLHAALALLAGAAVGRRGASIAAATVVFVAGYLLVALSQLVDALSWAGRLSPFHHGTATNAVAEGWPVGSYILLALLIGVAVTVAVPAFGRRDLRT